jgi:hypothetical protein
MTRRITLILAFLLVACSSQTEPTIPPPLAGMPEACIDALVGYLQAIEPAVEGVDFENLSVDELDAVSSEVDDLSGEMTAEMEDLDCPDPLGSDDEALSAVIDLAEQEAPGTVGYLEWLAAFAAGFGEGSEVSGDCESDIAALEGIIAEAGAMSDLTMTQVVEVGSLVASISTACSPERAEEFFAREDVAAFLDES